MRGAGRRLRAGLAEPHGDLSSGGISANPKQHAAVAPLPALALPERSVLEALDDVAISFELVSERSGLTLAATAIALDRLATFGLAARSGSGWERRPPEEDSLRPWFSASAGQ